MRMVIAGLLMCAGACLAQPNWCERWLSLARANRDAYNELKAAREPSESLKVKIKLKIAQIDRQRGLLEGTSANNWTPKNDSEWAKWLEENEPHIKFKGGAPAEEIKRIAFGDGGTFRDPKPDSLLAQWKELQELEKKLEPLQQKYQNTSEAEVIHLKEKSGASIGTECPEQLAQLNKEHVPVPGEDIGSFDHLQGANTGGGTAPPGPPAPGGGGKGGGGTDDEFRARLINVYLVSASAEDDINAMRELYKNETRGGQAGSNTGNVVIAHQMKLFRAGEKRQIGDADPEGLEKLGPGNATVRTPTGVAIRGDKWAGTQANAPQGAVLELLEKPDADGWVKVKYQGTEGYASGLWLAP